MLLLGSLLWCQGHCPPHPSATRPGKRQVPPHAPHEPPSRSHHTHMAHEGLPADTWCKKQKCFILASTYSLKSLYGQLKERFRCFLFQFIPIRNLSPDKQGRQRLGQRSVLQPLLWHRLLLLQLLLGGGWGAVLGRVQRALWCLLVLLRRGDGGQWVLS